MSHSRILIKATIIEWIYFLAIILIVFSVTTANDVLWIGAVITLLVSQYFFRSRFVVIEITDSEILVYHWLGGVTSAKSLKTDQSFDLRLLGASRYTEIGSEIMIEPKAMNLVPGMEKAILLDKDEKIVWVLTRNAILLLLPQVIPLLKKFESEIPKSDEDSLRAVLHGYQSGNQSLLNNSRWPSLLKASGVNLN